jgi:hypothetical protein
MNGIWTEKYAALFFIIDNALRVAADNMVYRYMRANMTMM